MFPCNKETIMNYIMTDISSRCSPVIWYIFFTPSLYTLFDIVYIVFFVVFVIKCNDKINQIVLVSLSAWSLKTGFNVYWKRKEYTTNFTLINKMKKNLFTNQCCNYDKIESILKVSISQQSTIANQAFYPLYLDWSALWQKLKKTVI